MLRQKLKLLFESHTGCSIGKVLKSSLVEWGLDKENNNHQSIAVVTDNARNMDVAMKEAGLSPHIKLFAHLNRVS